MYVAEMWIEAWSLKPPLVFVRPDTVNGVAGFA